VTVEGVYKVGGGEEEEEEFGKLEEEPK
jgi:hypothetical protein